MGRQWYLPYGDQRHATGSLPTDYRFTGQRIESTIGELYDYGARFYDPVLGRFVSADTVVPEPGNPQALNRYSYVLNNSLKYTDPSGHRYEWGYIPDEAGGGKYEPPTPDWLMPTSDDKLDIWISKALTKVYYHGGWEGRGWVRKYAAVRPPVIVYDIPNEYIMNLGSGHWWGSLFLSTRWLNEEPDVWRSSVLIHEFVHYEQMQKARVERARHLAETGEYGWNEFTLAVWAGNPSLEKERGTHYVQWKIRYNMTPGGKEAERKKLADELKVLERGGPEAYNWLRERNVYYRDWIVTIWSEVDTTRWFPLGF